MFDYGLTIRIYTGYDKFEVKIKLTPIQISNTSKGGHFSLIINFFLKNRHTKI